MTNKTGTFTSYIIVVLAIVIDMFRQNIAEKKIDRNTKPKTPSSNPQPLLILLMFAVAVVVVVVVHNIFSQNEHPKP
jgi:hypothetical protein